MGWGAPSHNRRVTSNGRTTRPPPRARATRAPRRRHRRAPASASSGVSSSRAARRSRHSRLPRVPRGSRRGGYAFVAFNCFAKPRREAEARAARTSAEPGHARLRSTQFPPGRPTGTPPRHWQAPAVSPPSGRWRGGRAAVTRERWRPHLVARPGAFCGLRARRRTEPTGPRSARGVRAQPPCHRRVSNRAHTSRLGVSLTGDRLAAMRCPPPAAGGGGGAAPIAAVAGGGAAAAGGGAPSGGGGASE